MARVDRRGFVLGAGAGIAAGLSPLSASLARAQDAAAGPTRDALLALLDTVRQLDETYVTPGEGVDAPWKLAEAHRYLIHLLAAGHDLFLGNDPERPRLARLESPSRKFMGGNPDAYGFFAPLRGDRAYRLRCGHRGEVHRSVTVYGGESAGGWSESVIAHGNDRDWSRAPDGSFELVLARERPAGAVNWLALAPDARGVITRHYFLEEDYAPAARDWKIPVEIEPLVDPGPRPEPGEQEVARRLRAMTDFVRDHTVMLFALPPHKLPEWFGRGWNRFGRPDLWGQGDDGGGWGEVDVAYSSARYRLGPHEALRISGRLPPCVLANVVLVNRWMQSFDWTQRRVSLNTRQTQLESDGSYRIIVAHADPGHPNWLDTGGRPEGQIDWRFVLPSARPQRPRAEVVPLASLRAG